MSLVEARRAWEALDAPSKAVSRLHADALTVLLLLGQRRGEVAGMRRDELDKHFRIWTIPADRHKTGRRKKLRGKPHVVPIPPEAGDIIERRWSISEAMGSEYIFSTKNNRPVGETYLTRDWRTVADSVGLNDVHLHDMRHTVATHMAAIGVQMEVISRVLNHQNDTSITNTIYNSHDYSKEKRAALTAWERRLLG
jgi:integrase